MIDKSKLNGRASKIPTDLLRFIEEKDRKFPNLKFIFEHRVLEEEEQERFNKYKIIFTPDFSVEKLIMPKENDLWIVELEGIQYDNGILSHADLTHTSKSGVSSGPLHSSIRALTLGLYPIIENDWRGIEKISIGEINGWAYLKTGELELM